MKKLSLFLTLSLLTLIGTSTIVKANPAGEQSQNPTPDSVIISQEEAEEGYQQDSSMDEKPLEPQSEVPDKNEQTAEAEDFETDTSEE